MHARSLNTWILATPWSAWLNGRWSVERAMAGWTLSLLVLSLWAPPVIAAHFTYHAQLEADTYSVSWTPLQEHIIFEVQVKTLGYVSFGFSLDGQMPRADVVTGWVKHGQVFFQDRWCEGRWEPIVDPSQDYELLLGYENGTHTVLKFRRKLDTCDDDHDIPITRGTMRMVWAYGKEDGVSYHGQQHRGSRSIYLLDGPGKPDTPTHLHWDINNTKVQLPVLEDTLYSCRVVQLPSLKQKHHVVRFDPILEEGHGNYVHHMILYECLGDPTQLKEQFKAGGQPCFQPAAAQLGCNDLVLTWVTGSQGLSFPPEAGYPLDPAFGPHYYMLETHYNNPALDQNVIDSSGLRVYYTKSLRRHDAGVLSVGLDPNWRHIIPPGQPKVVSEGHCIAQCTNSLPQQGISVFAALLHTHRIATKIRLRHIRGGQELPPIAMDDNVDPGYQEIHHLHPKPKVYPGDHLMVECVYNSTSRATITLGGQTIREEKCLVFALYYPRTHDLSQCHSLPSLPTVLHSLGIQQLYPDSNPVAIKSPPELADMTLETRLVTYDWDNNFLTFQEATHRGSFKPICWGTKTLSSSEASYPNFSSTYTDLYDDVCPSRLHRNKLRHRKKPGDLEEGVGEGETEHDEEEDNSVERVHESSRLNNSGDLNFQPTALSLTAALVALTINIRYFCT